MRPLKLYYTPEMITELAKVTSDGIWNCLSNINFQPEREAYWRNHADMIESKFKTEFGRHYSYFLEVQK